MIKSKYLIIIATIALFLGAGVGASGIFSQTATSGTAPGMTADASYQASGIEPNPEMNTNITWSNFYSGWNPLEYSNGTTNLTLQTNMSSFYKNPITVNPMNIQAPGILQNDNISGSNWQNASRWDAHGALATGEVQTIGLQNGQIYVTGNTSDSGSGNSATWIQITPSTLPSTSLQYDYFTFALKFSASATVTGETANVLLSNASGDFAELGNTITPGQVEYVSLPLSALPQSAQKFFTFNQNSWTIQINTNTPTSATASVTNASISGLAITENPLYLGLNNNGTNTIERYNNTGTGTIALTNFSPDFAWSEITDNGYTAATSQVLQNITTSQSSINSGNYIEQVTYQGSLSLPTAPDLSYSNSNITMPISIDGKQFIVANLNGVSYTSTLSGMKNGTLAFGTVNPNSANTIVLEVDYTASQWNSVSNAPSFWTNPIGAIEYYWYISLGVLLGAIGLGAGMSSRSEAFRGVKK